LPTAAKIAAKFDIQVVLFRAYTNPFIPFIGGSGPYGVEHVELTKRVRDQAAGYLEATQAALKKNGIEKISCVVQEGNAASESSPRPSRIRKL
jgi:hypothetical protein